MGLIQRPVRPEGFVRDGLDGNKPPGKQLLNLGPVGVLRKQPMTRSVAPLCRELVLAEEDIRSIGIAGAPYQRRSVTMLRTAFHDNESRMAEEAMRIEDDR